MMAAVTPRRPPKAPRAVAHCGQCDHVLVRDARGMWCVNAHCPQRGDRFVAALAYPDARPAPQPDKEIA